MSEFSNNENGGNFKPGVDWSLPLEAVHVDGAVVPARLERANGEVGYVVAFNGMSGWPVWFDGSVRGANWTIRNVAVAAPADAIQGDLTGEGSPGASEGVEASGGAVAGRDTVTLERMTLAQWQDRYSDCVGHWAAEILRDLGLVKEEPQDTSLQDAREICAQMMLERCGDDLGQRLAKYYRAGAYDDNNDMTIALRALEKGKRSC